MSRSLKKGPFVEPRLLGRIEAMNAAGEKDVIKTLNLGYERGHLLDLDELLELGVEHAPLPYALYRIEKG